MTWFGLECFTLTNNIGRTFIRLGTADAVPLEELQMPQLPVWMVTLLTPNIGILHNYPNPQQLIETLNNLEVSVAWTVLVDYADVND
jgi:hypothetical protein